MKYFLVTVYISVLLLIPLLTVVGQQLNGQVQNPEGETLPHATVQLLAAQQLLTYTITNAEGKFTLEVPYPPADSLRLVVRFLGYKAHEQKLNRSPGPLLIVLQPSEEALETVVIEAEAYNVIVKEDTLQYQLDYIRSGREQTLGELLNKLPGVVIDEASGNISVNGKQVEKLLIDGEEILPGQQGLATKNLPAHTVEGVEALLNYQDPMQTGHARRRTNVTALNIQLSDTARQKLLGSAEAIGAYPNRYRAATSLFSLKPGNKITAIARANNTGQPIFTLDDYIQTLALLTIGNGSSGRLSPALSAILTSTEEVAERNSQFGLLNYSGQPNPKLRVNAYALAHRAQQTELLSSRQEFFTEGEPLLILNEENRPAETRLFSGWGKVNYAPTAGLSLQYSVSTNATKAKNTRQLLNTSPQESQRVRNNTKLQQLDFRQQLKLNNRFKENIYWETSLEHQQLSDEQNLTIDADAPILIFPPEVKTLNQPAELQNEYLQAHHSWTYFTNTYQVKAQVNASWQRAKFISNVLLFKADQTEQSIPDDFQHTYGLNRSLYSGELTAERVQGFFRYQAGFRYLQITSEVFNTAKDHYVLPVAKLELHFAPAHRLSLSYNAEINPYEPEVYYQGLRIGSFQQLLNNQVKYRDNQQQHRLGLRYLRINPLSKSLLLINSNYRRLLDDITQNTEVFNNYSQLSQRLAPPQQILTLNIFLEKELRAVPVKFRLLNTHLFSHRVRYVYDQQSNLKTYILSGEVSATWNFNKAYDFGIGLEAMVQRTRIDFPVRQATATSWAPYIDGKARYASGFSWQFRAEQLISRSGLGLNQNFTRLDVQAGYRPANSKWEWLIEGRNVTNFNSPYRTNLQVQSDYIAETNQAVLPGYAGLGIRYWFN